MYENNLNICLFNINTGEKIKLASSLLHFGGLSPDGKYAFYSESDRRIEGGIINGNTYVYSTVERNVVHTVPLSTVFYVAENADFFLFKLLENPLYSHKVEWIVRSDLISNSQENWDTLIALPDSLWIHNLTDSYTIVNLTKGKVMFFDFDSLLNKKLHLVFSSDQNILKSDIPVDINLSTGIYTRTRGSNVIIGNIYQTYQDTSFLSSYTRE
jgi:hypothetical protein